jgi:23S rRNA (guanine745-N1)-methyltransferase
VDAGIVTRLRCPTCQGTLEVAGSALRCARGHSFDVARHGYVDLSGGRLTHDGDTPAMIAAREQVQRAGHFDFLTAALVDLARAAPVGLTVDVGAGTGHHLAAVVDARPGDLGLAVDVSKAALRRAARAHPRVGAVRADAWRRIPVARGAATLVLNVFAPRSGAELARLLAPGGRLLVVTPQADHLAELALPVAVDPAKEERLNAALAPRFVREDERRLRRTLRLSADDARALAEMGPSARHGPGAGDVWTSEPSPLRAGDVWTEERSDEGRRRREGPGAARAEASASSREGERRLVTAAVRVTVWTPTMAVRP